MRATAATPGLPAWLAACAVAALLCACALAPAGGGPGASGSPGAAYKGEAALGAGLRQYQAGEYPGAAKSLHSALALGLSSEDRVKAHKHLAFIHCAAGRERACRDEFRKALDIDPGLELTAAESGHPVWGPLFRTLKASR
jgi:Tfp pilus assembly protein PilF